MMKRDLVIDRSRVIHSVDDGDILIVIQMLHELFEAGMEIPNMRRGFDDPLAVEFEDEAERGVGGRMLRAEIEGPFVVGVVQFVGKENVGRGFGQGVGHRAGL